MGKKRQQQENGKVESMREKENNAQKCKVMQKETDTK